MTSARTTVFVQYSLGAWCLSTVAAAEQECSVSARVSIAASAPADHIVRTAFQASDGARWRSACRRRTPAVSDFAAPVNPVRWRRATRALELVTAVRGDGNGLQWATVALFSTAYSRNQPVAKTTMQEFIMAKPKNLNGKEDQVDRMASATPDEGKGEAKAKAKAKAAVATANRAKVDEVVQIVTEVQSANNNGLLAAIRAVILLLWCNLSVAKEHYLKDPVFKAFCKDGRLAACMVSRKTIQTYVRLVLQELDVSPEILARLEIGQRQVLLLSKPAHLKALAQQVADANAEQTMPIKDVKTRVDAANAEDHAITTMPTPKKRVPSMIKKVKALLKGLDIGQVDGAELRGTTLEDLLELQAVRLQLSDLVQNLQGVDIVVDEKNNHDRLRVEMEQFAAEPAKTHTAPEDLGQESSFLGAQAAGSASPAAAHGAVGVSGEAGASELGADGQALPIDNGTLDLQAQNRAAGEFTEPAEVDGQNSRDEQNDDGGQHDDSGLEEQQDEEVDFDDQGELDVGDQQNDQNDCDGYYEPTEQAWEENTAARRNRKAPSRARREDDDDNENTRLFRRAG